MCIWSEGEQSTISAAVMAYGMQIPHLHNTLYVGYNFKLTLHKMILDVTKTTLKEILYLRNLFLQENNFQIRYNSRHERGLTDSYIVMYDKEKIGYGSVAGYENPRDRNTVFEFYIIPSFRNLSSAAFLKLLLSSKAVFIECQSNDFLLTLLLYEYGHKINSNTILFEENITSDIRIDKILFRKRK